MIGFFSAATALLLTVLALVAVPLLRARHRLDEDRQGDVVALGRERLEELRRRKESGDISDAEYEAQVGDLEAQLADDLQSQARTGATPGRRGGRWAGIAVVVFIPVLSGLLYLSLGTPQALRPGATERAAAPDEITPENIDAMVSRLAQRLRENPDDAEGWFMLARSYMVLKRYQDAADAFRRLRGLVGDRPEVLVREATALAMAGGGDLSGEPRQLIQQALAEAPENPQALWMAATAAYQDGDHATALEYYRRVEPLLEGEPLKQVQGMIEQLTAENEAAAAAAPADPSQQAVAVLRVSVSLDPSLQSQVAAGDSLFVFAKAVDGPAMPLAVVRKRAADLPLTVRLDDTQAMMPQLRISEYEQVTVGARISGSGSVAAAPGDLEGEAGPVATDGSEPLTVTIDRVVPPDGG